MLEHGASTDEVHILLGKSVAAQILHERSEPISLPSSQYDSASSWNSRFRRGFEKHLRERFSNYRAGKAKAVTYISTERRRSRISLLPRRCAILAKRLLEHTVGRQCVECGLVDRRVSIVSLRKRPPSDRNEPPSGYVRRNYLVVNETADQSFQVFA